MSWVEAAFTAIIQIGTELAVLLYFARDIARIVTAWTSSLVHRERRADPDARMGWLIIIGSLPIVVLGLLLKDTIETTFRDLRIVAAALIVFSVFLLVADRVGRRHRTLDQLTVGLLLGYTRTAAARYSFLLAVPAVLGSGLFQADQALSGKIAGPPVAWGPTVLATVISSGVGSAVIAWLLRHLQHGSFLPFVVHRIAVGVLVLALVGGGAPVPG